MSGSARRGGPLDPLDDVDGRQNAFLGLDVFATGEMDVGDQQQRFGKLEAVIAEFLGGMPEQLVRQLERGRAFTGLDERLDLGTRVEPLRVCRRARREHQHSRQRHGPLYSS